MRARLTDVTPYIEELEMSGCVNIGKCGKATAYRDRKRVNDYLEENGYDWRVKLSAESGHPSYVLTAVDKDNLGVKAWLVTDECSHYAVVFAKTRGQARSAALLTDACENADYTDIRATRIPVLDRFYRGETAMDWDNVEDRKAMARYGKFACSIEERTPPCGTCPAKEWCMRYTLECQHRAEPRSYKIMNQF